MVLEFVVDYDQWIRHVFIGMTGSHNDINILQNPLMFARITKGHAPEVNYEINVQAYNKVYYLANNIYKKWLIFVKTITKPFSENKSWFAICHESYRKDAERTFGVLQDHFAIFRHPDLTWSTYQIWKVMNYCVSYTPWQESERVAWVIEDASYDCHGPIAKVDHVLAVFGALLTTHQRNL
jgi:hypothetical protein